MLKDAGCSFESIAMPHRSQKEKKKKKRLRRE